MDQAMSELVRELRTLLAGADYLCESPFGGTTLRVRFIGHFEQQPVVWAAELIALAATNIDFRQFVDISTPNTRGVPITIGLRVSCIDRPTLLKTLIMVRNYKRLRAGRHEFGYANDAARTNATSGAN